MRSPMLEETFFEGIRALPPATWCEIPIDGDAIEPPRCRRYWDLNALCADDSAAPPYDQAVEKFESLLLAAVASHRIADVKVGSLLSGGLDSSTLSAMLSEFDDEGGRQFPTFSFGFREREPDTCEMPYVDTVVQHQHLLNHETTFDPLWIRENTSRVVYALEEPLLGIQPLAQYRVLQLARDRRTTVLFDGQGSDELFAGYQYHQRLFLVDLWRRRRIGSFARELRAIQERDGGSSLAFFLREMVMPSINRRLGRVNGMPDWIEPSIAGRHDPEFLEAMTDRGRDDSSVNAQIHFDVRWGNAKTVLGFGDRNGMAHSLEVRVPYFDRQLVEFAMTLPDHYKIGNGDRKRILRDVARRRLPPTVTDRRDRIGFAVPTEKWMRNDLWKSARETICEDGFLSAPFFRRQKLENLIKTYESGHGTTTDVATMWRLHSLSIWKTTFGVSV
jgi:asparagine synthase (glutamine-hydrolysing)